MNEENIKLTQEMWKDCEDMQRWLRVISHPERHIRVIEGYFFEDEVWREAEKNLKYILLGEEK